MGLKIGIVGLPNVGKSTLFNALVGQSQAQAANYPFCTIEPNVGIVEIPDERLAPLAQTCRSARIVPAVIEFVDIAGLVRGASQGEGLGNQFLAHIRECDAVAMVTRFFADAEVVHVEGRVDPLEDLATIELELQLADLATVEKRLYAAEKDVRGGRKGAEVAHRGLLRLQAGLSAGQSARQVDLAPAEQRALAYLSLLTAKPALYIANVSERQLADGSWLQLIASANGHAPAFLPISARLEEELVMLQPAERAEYLRSLGLAEGSLSRLAQEAYRTLGLITYFTAGEMEARAWTIRAGDPAPRAAAAVHTDFERGFIAADIVPWEVLVREGGWVPARSKGLVRTEGKTYLMRDGDVAIFKVNPRPS